MPQIYQNNFSDVLGAPLSAGATTLTLTRTDLVPIPSGSFLLLTLTSADKLTVEIIKVTAHTAGSTSCTIVKGQEGTTDRSWSAGSTIEARLTAGSMAELMDATTQLGQVISALSAPSDKWLPADGSFLDAVQYPDFCAMPDVEQAYTAWTMTGHISNAVGRPYRFATNGSVTVACGLNFSGYGALGLCRSLACFMWEKTLVTTDTSSAFYDVIYANGLFVAVGGTTSKAYIYTSTDGAVWTERTPGVAVYLTRICWNGSKFVAVGRNGACVTSPDGITWTSQAGLNTAVGANEMTGVCWDATRALFVAVGAAGKLATSPDAVTWTLRTTPFSASRIEAVAGYNGVFVAIVKSGNSATCIARSTDGISWAFVTTTASSQPSDIISVPGSGFYVCDYMYNNPCASSTDGITWTNRGYPNQTGGYYDQKLSYIDNKMVCLLSGYTSAYIKVASVNVAPFSGSTWTYYFGSLQNGDNPGSTMTRYKVFTDSVHMILPNSSTTSSICWVSLDGGHSWQNSAQTSGGYYIRDVFYAGGAFWALCDDGSNWCIQRSTSLTSSWAVPSPNINGLPTTTNLGLIDQVVEFAGHAVFSVGNSLFRVNLSSPYGAAIIVNSTVRWFVMATSPNNPLKVYYYDNSNTLVTSLYYDTSFTAFPERTVVDISGTSNVMGTMPTNSAIGLTRKFPASSADYTRCGFAAESSAAVFSSIDVPVKATWGIEGTTNGGARFGTGSLWPLIPSANRKLGNRFYSTVRSYKHCILSWTEVAGEEPVPHFTGFNDPGGTYELEIMPDGSRAYQAAVPASLSANFVCILTSPRTGVYLPLGTSRNYTISGSAPMGCGREFIRVKK